MKALRDQLKISQKETIKSIRKHYGLSQDGFAKAIGCEKTTLWFYENGKRLIGVDTLYAIWEVFGVSPDMVLGIKPIRYGGKIKSLQM